MSVMDRKPERNMLNRMRFYRLFKHLLFAYFINSKLEAKEMM